MKSFSIAHSTRGIYRRSNQNQYLRLREGFFNNVDYGISGAYWYTYHSDVLLLIDNVAFSNGDTAIELTDRISENELMVNVTYCTFKNYDNAINIGVNGYYHFNNGMAKINVHNCTFSQNDNALLLKSEYVSAIFFVNDNIFIGHREFVLNMIYASQKTSLIVTNNVFEFNEKTVIRVPNILKSCQISNNMFWNNTGKYVVNIYERYPLSSAVTEAFLHTITGNIITDNNQALPSDDKRNQCVIQTRIHNSIIRDNVFNNENFGFELCLGAYPYYGLQKPIDARYNCWNTMDENDISARIFDIADWNDRPQVVYYPYSSCNRTDRAPISTSNKTNLNLGGLVYEDLVLAADDGPFLVESDVTVAENVTLTIKEGTRLQFNPNVGLLVFGRLQVLGTKINPVELFPAKHINTAGSNLFRDIRLTGGNSWFGRLEILYNGVWGSMYYYHWSAAASRVACKQLGFDGFEEYRRIYETPIETNAPEALWFWYSSYGACLGTEDRLTNCTSFTLTQCNSYACRTYYHDSHDTVLKCTPGNYWGGVRIVGAYNFKQNESILQYTYIIGAGQLHDDPSPGLLLRYTSVHVDYLTVADVISDGIVIDSPKSGVRLQNTKVLRCRNGIVLRNADHVPSTFLNVSSNDNLKGFTTAQVESLDDIPKSLFGIIPLCSDRDDDVITVEKYTEVFYQSRNRMCNVVIKPKHNETLILEVIRLRPKKYNSKDCFADIDIFNNGTGTYLGKHSCSKSRYLRIVASMPGDALRIVSDPYDNYYYNDFYDEYYSYFSDSKLSAGYLFRIWAMDVDGKCINLIAYTCNYWGF